MKKWAFVFLFLPTLAFSWGGRGHHAICEAASFLVKDKNLKEYLKYRSHTMGHLCNIPDTYWKNLGAETSKLGNPTHYVDPEILGLKISDIPLDYSEIVKKYTGAENKFKPGSKINSIPEEFGSNWWRADQFFRKIAALDFKNTPLPDKKEQQNDSFPFNQKVYDMTVFMGLMGHFVGDNSMPYHSSANHDGWETGHGGIHSYYETDMVSDIQGELVSDIQKKAKSLGTPSFLKGKSVLEKMRALSALSASEMTKIEKMDVLTKKSMKVKEHDMEVKKAAERKPSEQAVKVMRPLIIEEMARSALLLAQLWDEAYVAAGAPDLKAYKSYKYPFTPDFVPPDYH